MAKPLYAQAWLWTLIAGIIIFIISIIVYEMTPSGQAVGWWTWFLFFLALLLVILAFIFYVVSNELVPSGMLKLTVK